jgi:hypothetical protein
MSEMTQQRQGMVQDTSAADSDSLKESQSASPFMELGSTGLKRAAGYVDEEFLPQLRGRKAVQVFKEMSENDPLVGSLLFTIDRLLRNVEWKVVPAGKTKEDADAATFVEECMEDMSHTWSDFISEVLTCTVFGWSWHEIVYKRRGGQWTRDSKTRSKHSDGLVGWRKMPIRAQETLLRWVFDETGDVRAMIQLAPPTYKTTTLPIERSLLFRYRHTKGSPEGVSMLRNAYRPWFMKKRLEEFEAIGVERDLAGLPIVKIPAEMLRAKAGTENAKTVEAFKKMVKSVRRDEQEGIVFPMAYDQDTKQPLYSFELLGSGGGRAFSTDAIIKRYEERILMTVLADFILVGHQSVGSYSLHTDKTGIFRTSLNSIANNVADVLNRHALPRLFMANGWRPEALPTIVPTDVDSPDITQLAQFMQALAGVGVNWFPDGDLENFVRESARLPQLDKDAIEKRRQMQQRTEATAMAQLNTEYIQSQQEVMMARMGQLPSAQAQPAVAMQRDDQRREEDLARSDAAEAEGGQREDQRREEDLARADAEGAESTSREQMTREEDLARQDAEQAEGRLREDEQSERSTKREDKVRSEDREHELRSKKLDTKKKEKPRGKS